MSTLVIFSFSVGGYNPFLKRVSPTVFACVAPVHCNPRPDVARGTARGNICCYCADTCACSVRVHWTGRHPRGSSHTAFQTESNFRTLYMSSWKWHFDASRVVFKRLTLSMRCSENPSPETDDNPMAVIMDSITTAAEYCIYVNPYVSPIVFWNP